jgi:predicted nucleic acid-binding protein
VTIAYLLDTNACIHLRQGRPAISARMNEPFVKVFDEEREMTVLLGLDRSTLRGKLPRG